MKKSLKIGIASVLVLGMGGAAGYAMLQPPVPNVEVVYNFPLGYETTDQESDIAISGLSAYEYFVGAAQDKDLSLGVEWYDFDNDGETESAFIASVNGLSTSDDWIQWWQFSVNNELALAGVSDYVPVDGDIISLDYKDGAELDALEWLVDNQNSDGSFGDTFFQDAFGLMALGDYEGSEVSVARDRAIRHVRRAQNANASFGSDNYTAVATMALLKNGLSLSDFQKGDTTTIDILLARQMDDGGWKSGTGGSDVDTTSWVMMALSEANHDVPESAVEYLLSVQLEGGAWGYNVGDTTGSVQYTQEALLGLAAADYPSDARIEAALEWMTSRQSVEGCYADGFTTALGHMVLEAWGEDGSATLACLSTLQNGDGSFGRTTSHSNAVDTGLALITLKD